MKKVFFLLAFLACTFISSAQIDKAKIPTDNKLKTKLDSLVDYSVCTFMKNSSRVGISIGIIKNGKQYLYNYGSTQKEKPELPTGNTVYELASITKHLRQLCLRKLFSKIRYI
jgi:D-alanyl-D-alanine-carboxypeptidase/D-alanyl-D-alanine-endopeptidase